jgi:D-methionine transport system permease protein
MFIKLLDLLLLPTWESIYMVTLSTFFAIVLGAPIGIALVVWHESGLSPHRKWFVVLDGVVNVLRSFPFIILMILLFPLSRFIVGTTIGTTATIVPLAIGAAPFVARVVEGALKEVDQGVIEAVIAMGTPLKDIIFKVLILESLPSLTLGFTLTIINVIGYSAMAGAIGGGGLGDLAIRYGFHRFQTDVMIASVVVIIVLVQGIQALGNYFSSRILKTRGL